MSEELDTAIDALGTLWTSDFFPAQPWPDEDNYPAPYGLYYILDETGRTAIPARTRRAANRLLLDSAARRVARDTLTFRGVSVEISTVFLVFNHAFTMEGPPILWETMTFSEQCARLHNWQYRYESWEQAEIGHALATALMRWELRRHPISHRRAMVARRKRDKNEGTA